MPAMKLTFTAAMRARDVSRPRAEHLAAAEAAEADKAKPSRVAAAMDERRGQAGFPRRRRGRPSR